jgi:hypothetical protein
MSIIINSEHVCVMNPLQKFLYLEEKSTPDLRYQANKN